MLDSKMREKKEGKLWNEKKKKKEGGITDVWFGVNGSNQCLDLLR